MRRDTCTYFSKKVNLLTKSPSNFLCLPSLKVDMAHEYLWYYFSILNCIFKIVKMKTKITLKSYAETFFCLAPLLDLNPYPSIKVINKSTYCM